MLSAEEAQEDVEFGYREVMQWRFLFAETLSLLFEHLPSHGREKFGRFRPIQH